MSQIEKIISGLKILKIRTILDIIHTFRTIRTIRKKQKESVQSLHFGHPLMSIVRFEIEEKVTRMKIVTSLPTLVPL